MSFYVEQSDTYEVFSKNIMTHFLYILILSYILEETECCLSLL